jgi:hypothetical protein
LAGYQQHRTGHKVNASTQQQKATERSAPGLSLLASQMPASLQDSAMAACKRNSTIRLAGQRAAASLHAYASYQQQAGHVQHHEPIRGSFDAYRWADAHHIRGEYP